MSLRGLLVPAVAAVLVVGACSDASGPSQEQYAAMADDVCKDGKEKVDELYMAQAVDEMEAAADGGDASVYVDRPERWVRAKVVPEYEKLSSALKSIPAPEGDAAYLGDLYGDLDQRIEVLHSRPGDGRAVIEADELLRDRFTSYGMEECPPPVDATPDYEDPVKVMEALAQQQEAEGASDGG